MTKGTIKIVVWDEGFCDKDFEIVDSNGFSLEMLKVFENNLDIYKLDEYREKEIVVKPCWVPEQIGNYLPPNIESEGYWEFEVIESTDY